MSNTINLNEVSLSEGFKKIFTKILTQKTNAFGVQIGAFDGNSFDETQPILRELRFPCLFVEPIPYYYNIMVSNLNYSDKNKFDNCAISTEDGESVMAFFDPQQFYENKPMSQEFCLTGMSSLFPIKNSPWVTPTQGITVTTKTLNTLLNTNNLFTYDIFLCDTEGHDYEIFKQVPDSAFETCDFWKLEIQHLDETETNQMVDRLKSNGYNVYTYHDKYPVYTDIWPAYAEHKCHDLVAIKPEILV